MARIAAYGPAATVAGLITTDTPIMMTVSEYDPEDFQLQAAAFVSRYATTRRVFPHLHWLQGHNHLSPVLEIGVPDSDLERHILDFIGAA